MPDLTIQRVWSLFSSRQIILHCVAVLLLGLRNAAAWSSADLRLISDERGGSRPSVSRSLGPQQLIQCINEAYTAKAISWETAMSSDVASLTAVQVLWSTKAVSVPVTIVTQLSLNRLQQLWAQCRSWTGPLSAAVFVAVQQDNADLLTTDNVMLLREAVMQMTSLFRHMERDPTACKLDMTLVYERYSERRAMMLYPVNALRNIARLQARTQAVALMDVDILMSSHFAPWLAVGNRARQLVQRCREKTAFVLPAFDAFGNTTTAIAFADRLVAMGKPFLVESVAGGLVEPFDATRFPLGHNATNFTRWYREGNPYQIKYSYRYEPWVIVDRRLAPWYDVRFRGYGQNKIVHIAHINATGFKFVVHPSAYIVHRPHKHTPARVQLVVDMKSHKDAEKANQTIQTKENIYSRSKALFDSAKESMDLGHFKPVLSAQIYNCMDTLPWWA